MLGSSLYIAKDPRGINIPRLVKKTPFQNRDELSVEEITSDKYNEKISHPNIDHMDKHHSKRLP